MSKTAVLALLIALGALGLGIFQIVITLAPSEESLGIRNVWSDFHNIPETTFPTSQDILVDDLLINFTVNSGESALFLFSAQALIIHNSWLYIYFSLDGVKLAGSNYPSVQIIDDQSNWMIPVTFYYVSNTLSPGTHNVSIIINGDNIMNEISRCSLLVQTFV